MDRRKSLGLIGFGSILMAQNAFPSVATIAGDNNFEKNFMSAFLKRWEGMRMHTFEVFEAMPDSQFGFQPTKEVKSFAKLCSHIGLSLDIYAEMIDGTPREEQIESVEKSVVLTTLQNQFERFENTMNSLNPDDVFTGIHKLDTRDGDIDFYDYDILMLAYNHSVHHKGQATTYLRLKEIAPPQYRF